MRAVRLHKLASPVNVSVEEIEKPGLTPDSVIVVVHAAALNPSDIRFAAPDSPHDHVPRTMGRDFAGIVVEGPSGLVGKEVYGSGGDLGITRDGTFADYLSIPLGAAALKPNSLSMAQAASVGVAYITAYKAVVDLAHLARGETLLIIGASGAVGTAASQIAKRIGATVIGTTRGETAGGDVNKHVDHLIHDSGPSVHSKVQELTGGKGVCAALNTVGGDTFQPSLDSLSPWGRLVVISAAGGRHVDFDVLKVYRQNLSIHGLNTIDFDALECAKILSNVTPGFDDGSYAIAEPTVLAIEDASKALNLMASQTAGKIALSIHS